MKDHSFFYLRLLELQKKSQKSFNKIERDLGYPRNSLANYRNGGTPSAERLIELSKYFNVSPEFMLGLQPHNNNLGVKNIFDPLTLNQKMEMFKLCYNWILSEIS